MARREDCFVRWRFALKEVASCQRFVVGRLVEERWGIGCGGCVMFLFFS